MLLNDSSSSCSPERRASLSTAPLRYSILALFKRPKSQQFPWLHSEDSKGSLQTSTQTLHELPSSSSKTSISTNTSTSLPSSPCSHSQLTANFSRPLKVSRPAPASASVPLCTAVPSATQEPSDLGRPLTFASGFPLENPHPQRTPVLSTRHHDNLVQRDAFLNPLLDFSIAQVEILERQHADTVARLEPLLSLLRPSSSSERFTSQKSRDIDYRMLATLFPRSHIMESTAQILADLLPLKRSTILARFALSQMQVRVILSLEAEWAKQEQRLATEEVHELEAISPKAVSEKTPQPAMEPQDSQQSRRTSDVTKGDAQSEFTTQQQSPARPASSHNKSDEMNPVLQNLSSNGCVPNLKLLSSFNITTAEDQTFELQLQNYFQWLADELLRWRGLEDAIAGTESVIAAMRAAYPSEEGDCLDGKMAGVGHAAEAGVQQQLHEEEEDFDEDDHLFPPRAKRREDKFRRVLGMEK